MALVKKSKIAPDSVAPVAATAPREPRAPARTHASTASAVVNQTIAERVAAATEELAAGLEQAAAATKELGRSMEQIASGAEEAAGASQEQSTAIKRIVANLASAKAEVSLGFRKGVVAVRHLRIENLHLFEREQLSCR